MPWSGPRMAMVQLGTVRPPMTIPVRVAERVALQYTGSTHLARALTRALPLASP